MSGHDDVHLPEDEQKKAGAPVGGAVGTEHKEFAEHLYQLLDSGEIDLINSESLVNKEVYDKLDEEWQDKIDISLTNMINQIRLIDKLRQAGSEETEAIHLHTMIEHLWEMKQRIEEHHDALKI